MAAITGLPSPPYLIPSDGRGEARWQETGSHIPSSQRGEGGRGPMLRLSDGLSVGALGPGASRSGDEAVGILAESLA